ncbi:MAG: TetR/AcrR family transcriptional regulator [Halioglobus sp.]
MSDKPSSTNSGETPAAASVTAHNRSPADNGSPTDKGPSKHAQRSASTRQKFIDTALALYAERSIDSVSVNEITIAAGQKNRNALQYHFGNRDGLLQAIIDQHSERVREIRRPLLQGLGKSTNPAQEAANVLILPLIQYAEQGVQGVHYVKLLSQLGALNSPTTNPGAHSTVSFQPEVELVDVTNAAIGHLSQEEAGRRLFLVVTMTFHGIADICRAHNADTTESHALRSALFKQITASVVAILCAPALETP